MASYLDLLTGRLDPWAPGRGADVGLTLADPQLARYDSLVQGLPTRGQDTLARWAAGLTFGPNGQVTNRAVGAGDAVSAALNQTKAAAARTTPAASTFGPQAVSLAGAFPQLAPHGERIQQAVAATGVPAQVWMAAIMSESEGNPNAVNPRTLATGLLQNLPTESPAGRGRGYGYSSQELLDPDLNLQIARDEFGQAWQATAGLTDPIERAVQTIARAQRYEGYLDPQSAANQRVRGFAQRAYSTQSGQVGSASSPAGGAAQQMLAKAQEWVHAAPRYALEGGATTRQVADCSGLIVGIMRELGTPFAAGVRTAEQIRQASAPVALGSAQPGDLIFFKNTYASPEGPQAATHVGIVTEQGIMLDTNESRGRPGSTSYLTPYWQQHFMEIRRPPQYAR